MVRLEDVNVPYSASKEKEQLRCLFTEIAMSKECKLRNIVFESHDLYEISPEIFSRVILRLEEVDLNYALVRRKQAKVLFTAIVEAKELRLKTIRMCAEYSSYTMSRVKPEVFSEASKRISIEFDD